MIFLDANLSTPPCSAAIEQMTLALQNRFVGEAKTPLIADFVGASDQDRFVFNGHDPVAAVFWTIYMEVARKEGKSHIVISSIEDAPTFQACKRLEELGCTIKVAPAKSNGQIDVEALSLLLSPRTALISVSVAQTLTGVIQPIEEIAELAQKKNILLHLDATAALGKMPFSFQESRADYLTFLGDRIHSVPSSGGIFVKEGRPVPAASKLDIPSLFALSAAAAQASIYTDSMVLEVARLRDQFEYDLLLSIPGAEVLFADGLRLPNTSVVSFTGAHQEALCYLLQRKQLFTNLGGTYSQLMSRLTPNETALSFSLSRMTTEEELKKAVRLISESVQTLRGASALLGTI